MAIKQVCLWWVRFPVPFNLNSHYPVGRGACKRLNVSMCVVCACKQRARARCACVRERETRLQTPNPLSFAFLLIHSCG